jgi:hypothetical protein
LDLSDPHATILPPENEAVEDGWQISMITGAAQIKLESIVDSLVRARPRQWLRQRVEDYDDEDDYDERNDECDEKECIPQEGDAIPTQPGESSKKPVESGDYHVSANESEEEEEEEDMEEDECLDPLEEQDRKDKEVEEGLGRGGRPGGSLVNNMYRLSTRTGIA